MLFTAQRFNPFNTYLKNKTKQLRKSANGKEIQGFIGCRSEVKRQLVTK